MGTGVSPSSWLPGFVNKSTYNRWREILGTRTFPFRGHVPNSGEFGTCPRMGSCPRISLPAFFVKNKLYGQASRAISTGKLHTSRCVHIQPIKQVVYLCPSALAGGRSYLGACFPLICFQRLSLPNVATQRCSWRNNWHTRGSFVQVLSYYGPPPSNLLRLPWIGTELSRDVLNPAHVPL